MKQRIKLIFASLAILLGVVAGASLLPATTGYAVDPNAEIKDGVNAAGGQGQDGLRAQVKNVVNVLLFILGIIAVIMIIIGGIRYATSGGDSTQITAAKNTILYSIIGLIVAILAYAIVNFIINAFA